MKSSSAASATPIPAPGRQDAGATAPALPQAGRDAGATVGSSAGLDISSKWERL
ncbi:MAG TPA: hypothetical protein VF099_11580 [Ktedonobacterales bacterium]